MNDLWASISGDFGHLTQVVSQYLSKHAWVVRDAMEQHDVPWSQIVRAFEVKPTFPKNIVRLALASDCLSWTALAATANGEWEEARIPTVYTLARPLSIIFAEMDRYRPYHNVDFDDVMEFLVTVTSDSDCFGTDADATRLLGWRLCLLVACMKTDATLCSTYESMIRSLVSGIFDGPPTTTSEKEQFKVINDFLVASRPEFAAESEKVKQGGPSDSAFAVENDDSSNTLVDDSDSAIAPAASAKESITPEAAMEEATADLESLLGLAGVKAEVKRLMAFLKIQQQRRQHGLRESGQTLHFVFTGKALRDN